MKKLMLGLPVGVPLLALLATPAHGEDYLSPTEERVRLSLGFMYVSSSTEARIDSSNGVTGTAFSAENDFGLEKSDVEPKFQAMLRVGERSRVRFDYFTLDRSGGTTIATPIIFRNVVLQTGDPLDSNLSMRTLGVTYAFSFLHDQRYEVAATIGVNETDISARARVSTPLRHVDQSEDAAGPIPTAGLDASWVVSKRFYIDARAQYLKANVDHLDGSLGFYELDALYRLRPNISFALGYFLVKTHLDSTKTHDSGTFDFDTKGPQLFVRVAF